MSARRPRPIVRGPDSLRDDRLFLIACDDQYAPKQYFERFRLRRVQVHVIPTEDGTSAAQHVLTRLLEFEAESKDERWLLLDTDHYIRSGHLNSFQAAITEAKQRGINIALSRPCFELWLLLHHVGIGSIGELKTAQEVEQQLRVVLGQYNKTNLREEDFPHESVVEAIERGRKLDSQVAGGDIPERDCTRVYKLMESIIRGSPASSLPQPLREWCAKPV